MAESRREETNAARVFISYSRKDRDVAEPLRDALCAKGLEAFLDVHDIAPGEPWQERLFALIARAEKVAFLISPNSVASDICKWEVDIAAAQGKGVLPIVITDTKHDDIPGALRRLNFFFFRNAQERENSLPDLFNALSGDITWERQRTGINDLAIEWDRADRPDRLLAGRDDRVQDMETWRDALPATAPAPTALQLAFISASRRRITRRHRWFAVGLSAVTAMVSGLAILANEARVAAGLRSLEAQLNAEAVALIDLVGRRDDGATLARAVHAYTTAERELGSPPQAVWNALRRAFEGARLINRAPADQEYSTLVWRADGGLSSATMTGEVVVRDAALREVRTVDLNPNIKESFEAPADVALTPTRRAFRLGMGKDGYAFFSLDGKPLFNHAVIKANTSDAIDVGRACLVRGIGDTVEIMRDAEPPDKPSLAQTATVTEVGAPRFLFTSADCRRVLIVGTQGNAAWLDMTSTTPKRIILEGTKLERWTASPDIAHVASYTPGEGSLQTWNAETKEWRELPLTDPAEGNAASLMHVALSADNLIQVTLSRSHIVYDFSGRALVQSPATVVVGESALAANKRRLAIQNKTTSELQIYDARQTKLAETIITSPLPKAETISSLSACGDGLLVVGGVDGAVAAFGPQLKSADQLTLRWRRSAEQYVRRLDCAAGALTSVLSDAGRFLVRGEDFVLAPDSLKTGFPESGVLVHHRALSPELWIQVGKDIKLFRIIDNKIKLLETRSFHRFPSDDNSWHAVDLDASSGRLVLVGSSDLDSADKWRAYGEVWRVTGTKLKFEGSFKDPKAARFEVASAVGNDHVAAASLEGRLTLFRCSTGRTRWGHLDLYGLPREVTPLGDNRFAIGSLEGDVQIWTTDLIPLEPSVSHPTTGDEKFGVVTHDPITRELLFVGPSGTVLRSVLDGKRLKKATCTQLTVLNNVPQGACEPVKQTPAWLKRFLPTPVFNSYSLENAGDEQKSVAY